jgi:hypothetical protein
MLLCFVSKSHVIKVLTPSKYKFLHLLAEICGIIFVLSLKTRKFAGFLSIFIVSKR